mgnify:CR=1 FL=1
MSFPKKMIIDAVIPARGGSKRIPGKNIKSFAGKPLIAWSIELAIACTRIRNVYVSTDSQEIAEVAKEAGATVITRPDEISGHLSTDFEFFQHLLETVAEAPEALVHLRPTYPTRSKEILELALDRFIAHEPSALRTVIPCEHPPYKCYTLDGETLAPLVPALAGVDRPYDCPTQLLPKTYRHNGYIDIVARNTVLNGSVSGNKMHAYVMSPDDVHDIDTHEEWALAEAAHYGSL